VLFLYPVYENQRHEIPMPVLNQFNLVIDNNMSVKKAKTIHPVIDLIRNRWSPRSFTSEPILESAMDNLLEAASWSFSGGNLQPWYYIFSHKGSLGFDTILNNLSADNRDWVDHAAVLMVCLAKKERDPGKPNLWSKHDLGAANMLLILQALSQNIYGHPIGGFDPVKMTEDLKIDTSIFEPVACIALGYLGDPNQLSESLRANEIAERKRKSIVEISKRI
jgi:nitroreductase